LWGVLCGGLRLVVFFFMGGGAGMATQYPRRLERLKVLADKLEAALDEAPITVKAQVAAQYRAALADIAALEGPEDGSDVPDAELDPVAAAAAARAARLVGGR
jgi:hypothetical protein